MVFKYFLLYIKFSYFRFLNLDRKGIYFYVSILIWNPHVVIQCEFMDF